MPVGDSADASAEKHTGGAKDPHQGYWELKHIYSSPFQLVGPRGCKFWSAKQLISHSYEDIGDKWGQKLMASLAKNKIIAEHNLINKYYS